MASCGRGTGLRAGVVAALIAADADEPGYMSEEIPYTPQNDVDFEPSSDGLSELEGDDSTSVSIPERRKVIRRKKSYFLSRKEPYSSSNPGSSYCDSTPNSRHNKENNSNGDQEVMTALRGIMATLNQVVERVEGTENELKSVKKDLRSPTTSSSSKKEVPLVVRVSLYLPIVCSVPQIQIMYKAALVLGY